MLKYLVSNQCAPYPLVLFVLDYFRVITELSFDVFEYNVHIHCPRFKQAMKWEKIGMRRTATNVSRNFTRERILQDSESSIDTHDSK